MFLHYIRFPQTNFIENSENFNGVLNSCTSKCPDNSSCGGPNGAHSIFRNFGAQPSLHPFSSRITMMIGCYNDTSVFEPADAYYTHSIYTCGESVKMDLGLDTTYFALGKG